MSASSQSLFERLVLQPNRLTWFEMFQGAFQKHSQKDADYAMIAGTTLDSVNDEVGMLQKWQKPWLFRKIFLVGITSSLLLFAVCAIMLFLVGAVPPAVFLLYFLIPPAVVPVTLAIFFWEMNAPRNITIIDVLRYFFTGGVLSLLATLFLNLFRGNTPAWMAPLTEEPAKLILALFFLQRVKKKTGRVYGLTGLAIGAAVGAGFAAFESAQYAYNNYLSVLASYAKAMPDQFLHSVEQGATLFFWDSFIRVTFVTLLRALSAVKGHVMYCAPYAAIAGLYMGDGKRIGDSLRQPRFMLTFLISFLCHMAWNMFSGINYWIVFAVITFATWFNAGMAMRASFSQLASRVPMGGNNAQTTSLRIQGVSGVHAGVTFQITRDEILIGSDTSCRLNYPVNTPGIDGFHSKLLVKNGKLYLAALSSQNGTWLNGAQCSLSKGYLLQPGDSFYLGTPNQSFQVI